MTGHMDGGVPVDKQTRLKTLPFHTLRMRAVIIVITYLEFPENINPTVN